MAVRLAADGMAVAVLDLDEGKELGPFGITANAVAPGFIATDMTAATAARGRCRSGLKPPLRRGSRSAGSGCPRTWRNDRSR